ncbi:cytosolic sulfotransferase 5-like [Prosopis cineraria]|uniref:cytosolic sulfotransferase 5-like n=1 Tax=Prosopis cineraria TaxID=364024 RepID=UPI00240ED998|nr:cytosolic sulfotransferase 5-like [Prosopis cineraria]
MAAENSKISGLTDILPNNHQETEEDKSQESSDSFQRQLFQYQGFWFLKKLKQGVLRCQNQFQARDTDVLLVTSPKSGTTWLKALIFAIMNRKTHDPSPTQSDQPHPLLTTNPHVLVPFLEVLLQHENMSDLSSTFPSSSPRIFASHIPYVLLSESMKKSRCKIVYLCRNPKDLFVSYWHFMSKLSQETQGSNSVKDSFEEFCRGLSIYGPFWDHMLGYYKESLERPWKILFLRFEELKNEPVRTLKEIANFIGYGFSQEEENGDVVDNILKLCSFENLSSLQVNRTERSLLLGVEYNLFFRHGRVGDWKNFLTIDMVERFNAITQEKLEKHGLKFS